MSQHKLVLGIEEDYHFARIANLLVNSWRGIPQEPIRCPAHYFRVDILFFEARALFYGSNKDIQVVICV